jgi:hypothetical protein
MLSRMEGLSMRKILIISCVFLFLIDLASDGKVGEGGPAQAGFGIHDAFKFPVSKLYSSVNDIFVDIKIVFSESLYTSNSSKLFNIATKISSYAFISRSRKYRPPP